MNKEEIKKREKQILELTNSFCSEKLDQEYGDLCKKLVLKLGRKREVPFVRGKLEIWAASVIHAIGSINFLFDKSFEPYVASPQISEYFGVNKNTVTSKSRQIRDMFKMNYFDSEFSIDTMKKNNPFNNLVMVDGFIVPLDSIPEDLQKMVKEARAEGRDISFTTSAE